MLITFLSDFGLEDDFVGTCHGVMKGITPDVDIIDITHGIQRHGVLQGAIVLANTLPYLPVGVHLAVVDPGVGGGRRSLALRSGGDRLFVGPDNGLLAPAAEKFGGITAAHEITNPAYLLDHVSATFHGRDVFSPVAAHLAGGVALADVGPEIEPESLVRLEVPKADVTQRRIRASCLYVDRFGNMELNLTRKDLDELAPEPGTLVELEIGAERYYAVTARTFADARDGEIILYEDAYENIAIAISGGSAAGTFYSAEPGVDVLIRLAD